MLQGRRRARLLSLGLVRTIGLGMFACIIVWQDSLVQLKAGLFAITSYRMVSPKGGAALAKSELEPLDSKYRPACCSATKSCLTLCNPMDFSKPAFPIHHQFPKPAQTHVYPVGDAIQPSHLLCSLVLLPSIFPSIRVLSSESVFCIRWPKHWSFRFSISTSNEYSGLISFRMDWLDLLAIQGTLKSLLQHHNLKAPILGHSAFFMVQLSHPYTTTGNNIALIRRTFVSKVLYMLFNMLSRLVITFLL